MWVTHAQQSGTRNWYQTSTKQNASPYGASNFQNTNDQLNRKILMQESLVPDS